MGVEPPFIYDKPSLYTFGAPTNRAFNPKAATQASWAPPPPPKVKKDGPLIEFNRHPDSYVVVPYGHLGAQPMNPNTKDRVKFARSVQLALRICALLGAIGSLFCVITIRKTTSEVGWIIRIGPGAALLHSVYATYHFCRDARSRPPASTASYQIFAGMIDTSLIPFFAFSAYMAYADYSRNEYGWDTLFSDDFLDYKIIYAFYLLCIAEGCLFLSSLFLDIYLAVIFRKIAQLPPDMSPLGEKDNLTARPRHKRNKSDLLYEKHLSNSTLASQRFSQQSSPEIAGRRVPFMHTRTDSADRLTLYGSEYARDSRASLRKEFVDGMKDPYSARASLNSSAGTLIPSRPTSAVTPAENARQAGAGLNNKPARSSGLAQSTVEQPASWLSYTNYNGLPSEMSGGAQRELDHQVRPMSPVSAMSGNEYPPVRASFENSDEETHFHVVNSHGNQVFGDENQNLAPAELTAPHRRSREPLGMNPPTPVNGYFHKPEAASYSPSPREALRETDLNSSDVGGRSTPPSRPSNFIGSGGKSRFYGNLRKSLSGKRDEQLSHDHIHDMLQRTGTVKTDDSGNFEVYGSESEYDDDVMPAPTILVANSNSPARSHEGQWMASGHLGQSSPGRQVRQVSNSTGYDLNNGYAGLDSDFGKGMARRREVSGKVAEEGRGYGGFGVPERRDGGIVTGQTRQGAAGWARFKGL